MATGAARSVQVCWWGAAAKPASRAATTPPAAHAAPASTSPYARASAAAPSSSASARPPALIAAMANVEDPATTSSATPTNATSAAASPHHRATDGVHEPGRLCATLAMASMTSSKNIGGEAVSRGRSWITSPSDRPAAVTVIPASNGAPSRRSSTQPDVRRGGLRSGHAHQDRDEFSQRALDGQRHVDARPRCDNRDPSGRRAVRHRPATVKTVTTRRAAATTARR